MRPAGEARLALLQAAVDLNTPAKAGTLRELATRSCVGREAALHIVRHMKRAGLLVIIRTRRVEYRNRPVAEYAPKQQLEIGDSPGADLGNVLMKWGR